MITLFAIWVAGAVAAGAVLTVEAVSSHLRRGKKNKRIPMLLPIHVGMCDSCIDKSKGAGGGGEQGRSWRTTVGECCDDDHMLASLVAEELRRIVDALQRRRRRRRKEEEERKKEEEVVEGVADDEGLVQELEEVVEFLRWSLAAGHFSHSRSGS